MPANVRSIEGLTRPAQIKNEVIDILVRTLGDAREGKITSIALATICSDGEIQTIASPTDNLYKMVGAVAQLQFAMLAQKREQ